MTGTFGLGPWTRRIVYGDPTQAELEAELVLMARVDRAHLVMLVEQRIVPASAAARLLACIDELVAENFSPLMFRSAPRGLYLMYEGYLIERLGPDVGGVLHAGRSRNDLKATVTLLRLREWLLNFVEEAVRLEAILLSRARAYAEVLMPAYTHFQVAMPITYGYYLLGVASALARDISSLAAISVSIGECPLGATAVAGTDLPIDPTRTARLLGFAATTRHALDAVASRDVALRLLASATSLAVVLSRLATDLQLWSTAEFGFIGFPDRLVGGSSAMPQKRNAFLLDHVKAKPGHAAGAWLAATNMMTATPFTNSIEVGTEAVVAMWPGFESARRSVLLSQVIVSGARPIPARMRQRAEESFSGATSLANRLVRQGTPFRTAHQMVSEAVRRAAAAGSTQLAAFGPPGWLDGIEPLGLELPEIVSAHSHGGGPGAFADVFPDAVATWADHRRWHMDWRGACRDADAVLDKAAGRLKGFITSEHE